VLVAERYKFVSVPKEIPYIGVVPAANDNAEEGLLRPIPTLFKKFVVYI
jgi:hypothetical protein